MDWQKYPVESTVEETEAEMKSPKCGVWTYFIAVHFSCLGWQSKWQGLGIDSVQYLSEHPREHPMPVGWEDHWDPHSFFRPWIPSEIRVACEDKSFSSELSWIYVLGVVRVAKCPQDKIWVFTVSPVGRKWGFAFGLCWSCGEGNEVAEDRRGSSARCLTVLQAGFCILYRLNSAPALRRGRLEWESSFENQSNMIKNAGRTAITDALAFPFGLCFWRETFYASILRWCVGFCWNKLVAWVWSPSLLIKITFFFLYLISSLVESKPWQIFAACEGSS